MRRNRGFTLVEAIVSLTIFTVIVAALSATLNAALNTQAISYQRQEDSGTVRAVFDSLTRDVQAAFASPNSPASVFMASSGSTSTSSGTGLLTLSTLTQHIQADSLMSDSASGSSSSAQSGTNANAMPQSDMALVRYSLDPQTGLLMRSAMPVPNTQLLSQTPDAPETALAENIVSLSLQFYDTAQQTWRDNWDYEQPNQAQQSQASGTSGGTSAASSANTASNTSTATGDTSLPGAVQVLLTIRKKDGQVAKFTTTIPVVAPQPQTNPNAQPSSSGTTGAVPASGG